MDACACAVRGDGRRAAEGMAALPATPVHPYFEPSSDMLVALLETETAVRSRRVELRHALG
jgi:hypothetical protein